jgi:hypothetical protein
MRTKTLILSGVVAALTSASVMAQVYSLNAVGYINVSVPNGFSIIADQLYANGQGVAQFLSGMPTNINNTPGLLDTQLLDGAHNGVTFFKLSGSGYAIVTANQSGWTAAGANKATQISLNPGEGIYVYNPFATNITLTFVGTVAQGATLTNTMSAGFNMVSSIVPQSGAVDSVLGLTPVKGDTAFLLTSSGFAIYSWSGTGWVTAGSATPGSVPTPAVGQGFFYYANIATGATEVWTRSFTITN